MRRLAAVLLVLAGSAGAAPTTDSDDASDSETDELEPVSVKATLVGTRVRFDARFELTADGPLPAPGESRTFMLPERAVITAATAYAAGQSHRLQLLAHADADKRLEALQDAPTPSGGRVSAIRLDATDTTATLELAVPRRTTIRLAVTLEAPACFVDDARHIIVPPTWADRLAGATRVDPSARSTPGGTVESIDERCGQLSDGKIRFALPANALAKRPGGEQRIGFDSARLPLGTRDVARLELSLAKQLTDLPRDLHTVFVVDHSRSLTVEEHEIQRAVIAGYLRAAPRARVQLVGYTRDARTQLAGWMLATQAGPRIERQIRSLPPRNGSNVDVGIETAATLLANVTGTRRIVLFTDARLADHFAEEAAQITATASLPPDTLIHVVSLGGFQADLARDDSHVLARLAKQTEGIAMRADLDDHGQIDALPLVRPVSLDNINILAPGWDRMFDGPDCIETTILHEGSSCIFLADGVPASGPLTVEGYLWNTKIARTIAPDPRGARSLARTLSTASGLPAELLEPIQNAALAVNGAWSLLAMWGPRGGYADLEMWGMIGIGSIGTTSHHIIDHVGTPMAGTLRPIEEVQNQLSPVIRQCKPRGSVSVSVELTKEEIVGVIVRPRDKRDVPLVECMTNNVWDTMLALADPPRHVHVTVDVQP